MDSHRRRIERALVSTVAAAAMLILLPAAAQAATLTVNTASDLAAPGCVASGPCSIRQALAAAATGDTIMVPPGDYKLTQGTELTMSTAVNIDGAGASTTTIDAQGTSRVLDIVSGSSPITLSGLTITGGVYLGALSNEGGAGIYVGSGYSDALTLSGVTITGNKATVTSGSDNGGAGIYDDGDADLTITNSMITANTATLSGSSDNSGGGGIYDAVESLALTGSTVSGNAVVQGAGGPSNSGGGGIYEDGQNITLTNSHVDGNSETIDGGLNTNGGGGVYQNGNNLTLTNSTVNTNKLFLTGSTGSTNGGGGVYMDGSTTALTNSSIDGNTASITGLDNIGGGGLYNDGGDSSFTGSTIADNTGTATSTEVSGNPSQVGGGAVYNDGGTSTYLNSTLSANSLRVTSAGGNNGGGAVFNDAGAVTMSDATIAGNAINELGGALFDAAGGFILKSTIIASNTATPAGNCAFVHGTGGGLGFTSDGFNLDSGNTCSLGPSERTNANAALVALANNGGPTETQALGVGSQAVNDGSCTDAGSNPVTTDQRGAPRPDPGDPAGVCDIGAFETQPTANTALPVIQGTPAQGDTLTCRPGGWSNGASAFTYQWKRNGVAITGATGASYLVQFADDANTLTCTVTGANADGPGAPATSAGVFVGNKSELNCPKPSGRLSGTKLGPLALGETLKKAEHSLRMHAPGPFGFTEFCLYAGFGIRAATPTSKQLKPLKPKARKALKGHLVIALTPSRSYNLDGILPGDEIASVPKHLHVGKPFVIGLNTWCFVPGKSATGVLKVRHGEIFEIGIANKQLTSGSRKSQKAFMQSFGR